MSTPEKHSEAIKVKLLQIFKTPLIVIAIDAAILIAILLFSTSEKLPNGNYAFWMVTPIVLKMVIAVRKTMMGNIAVMVCNTNVL